MVVGAFVAAIDGEAAVVSAGCNVLQPDSVVPTNIKNQSDAVTRGRRDMIESGMWIFLVEAVVAGCLFIGLIWWVVKGTGERDRRLKAFDEKARLEGETRDKKTDNH